MISSVDKRLIFEHFANKTNPLQKRLIEEWLADETNQEHFYAWLVEWENQSLLYLPEIEVPLQRYVQHIQSSPASLTNHPANTHPSNPTPLRIWSIYRWVAAASILIILTFVGWLKRDAILYQTYHTAFGQIKTVHLPDGSLVNLSSNSSLKISRFGFSNNSRDVLLTGEASFAVTHRTNNQKFVVRTGRNFDVVVHGTEFTVNTSAYRANVMLQKGKVQINSILGKTHRQIMLKPGDLVVLAQPNHLSIQHFVNPQTYTKWKEQQYIFDNMTLADFGKLLTETYGLHVEIPNQTLAQRTLAGSFSATNADELLQPVAELFSLTIVRQNGKILLTDNN